MKVLHRKGHLHWVCPASICGSVRIPVDNVATPKSWQWNGSTDKPTIMPSVKVTWDFGEDPQRKHFCCHCNVTDGVIQFCGDCTHELAGMSVPMTDMSDDDICAWFGE